MKQRPPGWRRHLPAWSHSLKVRLACGSLVAIAASVAVTAWVMGTVAQSQLLAAAERREHAEAARTAAVIGRRVAEMQRALELSAGQLVAADLASTEALRTRLQSQGLLREMFANIAVADRDGDVVLQWDHGGARRPNVRIPDREYFRRTLNEGRPQVSSPLPGRISNEPIVVFTHPVPAADGGVHGVLIGTMRLASRDLLADLAEARDDDADVLIVVSDGEGRILAHPQRARLLERLDTEPRLAAAHARWLADKRPLMRDAGTFSDALEIVGSAGEGHTGWQVWRVISRERLAAPLAEARREAALSAGGVAMLLSLLLLVTLRRQLRPLHELADTARAATRGDDEVRWPDAQGEIGELARALQRLWAERLRAAAGRRSLLAQLSSVMAAAPVGLALTRERRYELVSAELARLLGRGEGALVGQPGECIFASHDDYVAMGPQVGAAFATGTAYTGEWPLRRADGSTFWARLQAQPVVNGDPAAGTIWCVQDISSLVDDRNRLQHAATHDALTGLLNRAGFERRLHEALSPDAPPGCLVLLDLDRFKAVNDNAGHAAGDAMLRLVADVLLRHIRSSDCAARLGGDEFALLLPGCPAERARHIADKLLAAVKAIELPWQGQVFSVGASFGVAGRDANHADALAWMQDADAACYAAKRSGRGRVTVSDPVGV